MSQQQPIQGMAYSADGLPTIDNYDDVADLPAVYNELSNATQTAFDNHLDQGSPSAPASVAGFRRITVSTSPPSGGADGDLWFQREA